MQEKKENGGEFKNETVNLNTPTSMVSSMIFLSDVCFRDTFVWNITSKKTWRGI